MFVNAGLVTVPAQAGMPDRQFEQACAGQANPLHGAIPASDGQDLRHTAPTAPLGIRPGIAFYRCAPPPKGPNYRTAPVPAARYSLYSQWITWNPVTLTQP